MVTVAAEVESAGGAHPRSEALRGFGIRAVGVRTGGDTYPFQGNRIGASPVLNSTVARQPGEVASTSMRH